MHMSLPDARPDRAANVRKRVPLCAQRTARLLTRAPLYAGPVGNCQQLIPTV